MHGDGDLVEKHKEFYDEYLAVMDLAAEYYLQTIDQVFVKHQLAKGEMFHRGRLIDLTAINQTALMTIEGEKDDITGLGQCEAALHLCTSLASSKKLHYTQTGVGHYGIFNGSRYRNEIVPRIVGFMQDHDVRGNGLHWLMHRLAGEKEVVPASPPALEHEPAGATAGAVAVAGEDLVRLSVLPAKPALRVRKSRALARLPKPHSRKRGL